MTILFAVLAAAMASQANSSPTVQAIIQSCWEGHAHPEMSECVRAKAASASTSLASVTAEISKTFRKSGDVASVAKFQATDASYQIYRAKQCQLLYVLASPSNAADDIRAACQASLDMARTYQLQIGLWWAKPDT